MIFLMSYSTTGRLAYRPMAHDDDDFWQKDNQATKTSFC